jgi:hypothetical protein
LAVSRWLPQNLSLSRLTIYNYFFYLNEVTAEAEKNRQEAAKKSGK